MDIDTKDEELADLHVDFGSGECDFPGESYLCGDLFAGFDSVID